MARMARVVVPGYPHHVTQRGNRRQQTFFGDEDYQEYKRLIGQWCTAQEVALWAWCLMPNHVHLVAVPASADGLRRALGEAHRRYTRRVNFRQGWRGHLWQGRFASFVLDGPHLRAAVRYVERNPVRAGLVARAWDWPWSSAAAHLSGQADGLVDLGPSGRLTGDWRGYLSDADDPRTGPALRRHEATGRPLGDDRFVAALEAQVGRPLARQKPGPKPKPKGN